MIRRVYYAMGLRTSCWLPLRQGQLISCRLVRLSAHMFRIYDHNPRSVRLDINHSRARVFRLRVVTTH